MQIDCTTLVSSSREGQAPIDGHREDIPVVVVRVFPDQIDSSGCGDDNLGPAAKDGFEGRMRGFLRVQIDLEGMEIEGTLVWQG